MENKVCPICGGGGNYLFATKNDFHILRCESCGGLFVPNAPKNTAAIYGKNYFWGAREGFGYVDYDADKEPMRPLFEKCLGRLEQIVGQKGSLLDVGAATGYFMKLAEQKGWQAEGVEIGGEAAEAGRANGQKITTGTIADIPAAQKFNAITMFDVLEHVEDPKTDLKKARSLLKSSGVLLIVTPDAGSLSARLMGKRWHLIVPPEHLTYFTRRGLSKLLKESDFEVISVEAPGKSFTLEYIFHTLYRWQKIGLWNWLLRLVRRFPKIAGLRLPINFRDNMLLYAVARGPFH